MHPTRCPAACRRFDHIFGNFRTEAGHVRRLDVIIAPAEECHFCVLGWSGSRQYLRFLRQWAVDLGMHLNSHRRATGSGGCEPPVTVPSATGTRRGGWGTYCIYTRNVEWCMLG